MWLATLMRRVAASVACCSNDAEAVSVQSSLRSTNCHGKGLRIKIQKGRNKRVLRSSRCLGLIKLSVEYLGN